MDIVSTIKHSRISPRKLRLLAKMLAGFSVDEAQVRLKLMREKDAKLLGQALATAVADATNNFKKLKNDLIIKTIQILEGSKMKRFRAISRGSAHSYKRRTSHIKVTLTEKTKNN